MGFELIPVQELLKEFYFCTVGWVLWEGYKQPCRMSAARQDRQLGRKATHRMSKNKNKLEAGKVNSDSRRK